MSRKGDAGVAFVLGGGGVMGASEVGMLAALLDYGVKPDLIIGTSVGAINGAVLAFDPTSAGVSQLEEMWLRLGGSDIFRFSPVKRTRTLLRSRTHMHSSEPLRSLLVGQFADANIEDSMVPFECVAASIERADEHWFTSGSVVDALLASSAVPGMFAPAVVDEEHFFDGGLVASIPIGRALDRGARTIYVLQVGRVESPLRPPSNPWEVGMVAFEIARRHRFITTMQDLPEGVTVEVLPTGAPIAFDDRWHLRNRNVASVPDRIARAYAATANRLSDAGRSR